ncbi:RNA helicase-related protein required for pre-mRNA splicing [Scheffersomyces amazonensis]|uniref:RNA helicase-related protein required for pre-mRNA splicing n=1 Tax=Scheffersomyces amazonensis TaxID=1078765 RepID=UPI00315DC631
MKDLLNYASKIRDGDDNEDINGREESDNIIAVELEDEEEDDAAALLAEDDNNEEEEEEEDNESDSEAVQPDIQSSTVTLTTGETAKRGTKRKLPDTNDHESLRRPTLIDLESFTLTQTNQLLSTTKIKLPAGSSQQAKKSYDIISIPAPTPPPNPEDDEIVSISSLPEWARQVFPSTETSNLNRIQSKVYPQVFNSDGNILLCAPTGAGKTNVAMLSILRAISNHRNPQSGKINLKDFKVVYIAPLKALVQEQMREFSRRLTPVFGVVVNELTGDSNLSRKQLEETQIIVTTPEKWDIVTRKSSQYDTIKKTKLVIIDEIHLLHDDRGPVLESIVSRILRNNQLETRLIGLSATLPNYKDVAQFLRVDSTKNLFYFDASYRPCPLEQKFIAIKEKKAIKRLSAMNEACQEQIEKCLTNNHQVIIFVHSRKETFKTAKWLQERLESINKSIGSIEILKQEAENFTDKNLQQVVPFGFGIHHAGLQREERSVVEDLFAQGHLKVLVSTATLAWGVNLPAHTVIIKGTETYSPEKGSWTQLSPQDILQMLGRAGRPRYDKSGEGIIITTQDEVQYYLAILNQQLPIESQLLTRLADSINAEIVLGTIQNRDTAVQWLGYTYLYIRMLQSPGLYLVGANADGDDDDDSLFWKRHDLAHSALTVLHENRLIQYDSDSESGNVTPTELGKIASHFYINYKTMNMYNTQLKPWLSEIELLKIFSKSGEFEYVATRQEERLEISKLLDKCPIPVREKPNETGAKINLLLQAYISRLGLEGYALMADMVYIVQSAGRLMRAMHEIALQKNWSSLSKLTLNLCKMIEKRMWLSSSPFRQFGPLASKEIIRATENSHFPWIHYFNLDAHELAEALNLKSNAGRVYELLKQFPKLDLSYYIQTITSSLIRVQVQIVADWNWIRDRSIEPFLVLVEDSNGERILYTDKLIVNRNHSTNTYLLDFTLPILQPFQPVYILNFISESWLHSEWKIPLNLSGLTVPKLFPAPTPLLEMANVPVSQLHDSDLEGMFNFSYFNKFQSQVFEQLYGTDESLFIGTTKGSGKTVCAELGILRHWKQGEASRIVYINSSQSKLNQLYKGWTKKFSTIEKVVGKLSGVLYKDLQVLGSSNLILATPEQFYYISKRWMNRRAIQDIQLLICDDIQELGNGLTGAIYEACIGRMKFMSGQLDKSLRIVSLSTPLANGRDLAEWIGCSKSNVFNFDCRERFYPIRQIQLHEFTDLSAVYQVVKPVINYKQNCLIFTSTRFSALGIASELVDRFTLETTDELSLYLERIHDEMIRHLLPYGIGLFYKGMHPTDELIVQSLFDNNHINILIATKDSASVTPSCGKVIIAGTQEYDGKDDRYIDYSINTILEMVGCCCDKLSDNSSVSMFTNQSKIQFYSKFLKEALPIESYLNLSLHEFFIDEISSGVNTNKQECVDWFTYTYFYRRLQVNPSYYDVKDVTHLGISEHLSELVETTLQELITEGLIEEDEEDEDTLVPLNGCMIAAHYGVRFNTMKLLSQLGARAKLKTILETLSGAEEFDNLVIRHNEQSVLSRIYQQVPFKANEENFSSPYFKAFILIQAHLKRIPLSIELQTDQQYVVETILKLVHACVDTLSGDGYLNALNAMTLSQMIIQAVWTKDSPLKQIPQFSDAILQRCEKYNVETVYDLMTLEDEDRDDILQLSGKPLNDVAEFVNKYPNIDISYELDLSDPIQANTPKELMIQLERDEDMDDLTVVSPHYPQETREGWWIVVGDVETKQLYSIKKATIKSQSQNLTLTFTIPNPGHHTLSIWCMCDSYVDADKEISIEVDVV